MSCNNINAESYNKFYNIRKATRVIVDYLFDNCPNLWKLLHYGTATALSEADVPVAKKRKMICKNSALEDTSKYNILFGIDTDDGLDIAVSQLRIEIGDIVPMDAFRGAVEINFQIVVPNKQRLIVSDYSDVDDRSLAIFQVLSEALNGTQLSCFSSKMYLDRRGDNGRRTGAYREKQNKNYSGYIVTYAALC